MKSQWLSHIYMISKYFVYIVIIQSAFANILAAGGTKGQNYMPLKQMAFSVSEYKTVSQVFSLIEERTDLVFSIDENKLEDKLDTKLFFDQSETNLEQVLLKISRERNIGFKRINNNVVVFSRKRNSESGNSVIEYLSDVEISGKITDENGQGLPGASVIEKGTTNGTTTDLEGRYKLNVSEEAILVVSFVGYKTQEVTINGRSAVDIQMEMDAQQLEDIVVIGYGSQSKAKITGAISEVKTEQFEKYATGNFENALTGAISGIQVNQNGANPGEDSNIIIRGTGTLTAGSNPLIVVDGFPLSEGSTLSSLNPNDIESIDVLKDAASAAIYGSRAANGVLLITTKKAKGEGLQVNVNVFAGVQSRSDGLRTIGAYDYAQYQKEARDYAYVIVDPANRNASDDNATRLANGASRRQLNLDFIEPYLNGTPGLTDTNWWDEIYNNAGIQNYNVSISNSTDKTRLTTSIGYLDQNGILIGSGTEKYTSNIRIDTDILKNLKLGMNLNTSYDQTGVIDANVGWGEFPADPGSGVYLMYPFFKPYNNDGSFAISEQIRAVTEGDGALGENTVAMTLGSKNVQNRFRSFGSAYLEYEIIDGLVAKTSLGGDFRSTFIDYYQPSYIGTYRTDAVNNQANSSETSARYENLLTENTLSYYKEVNKHSLDFLGGFSYQQENLTHTVISATGIVDDNLDNIAAGSSFSVVSDRQKWAQVSYFGRIQYDFDSKYLLSASLRTDGSSRFGDNSKWGVFKSVSAGWLISNEGFFPENSKLSLAKVRASWGQTGNNQIGAFGSKALVGVDNYTIGGSLAPGFATSSSPNDNLSWETNTSVNLGLDLGFFDNKLLFTGEYYVSTTKDLLLDVPVPQQSGFNSSLQNVGKVRNSGIELELRGQDIQLGDFTLGFNANISTNSNEVLALGPDQDQIIKSSSGFPFRTRVGGPIAELYGYDVIGVYKSQSEIDSSPSLPATQVGDYIVRDTNGDGQVNADDRIGLGTFNPDFIYAFGANLKYKNFDFSFGFTGVEGRNVYDFWTGILIESGESFVPPTEYFFQNRYHPENNPDGFLAQPNNTFSAARVTTRQSTNSAQTGDFIRLRSLQIGYNLPQEALEKIGVTKLRLYLSANNLFTITSYRGVNPESGDTDPLLQGFIKARGSSVPRIITTGISLTF
ncbi:TonB-dependent receptor [Reichenbachiella sp. MALMAid0571]|uniref:SusC/RagA family TonB-linked outer membrane protein n=1 Tax=Reichenbachiella sp. MALMAid0571 TaxID=3143939 RepID=UPI0032DEBEE6